MSRHRAKLTKDELAIMDRRVPNWTYYTDSNDYNEVHGFMSKHPLVLVFFAIPGVLVFAMLNVPLLGKVMLGIAATSTFLMAVTVLFNIIHERRKTTGIIRTALMKANYER